MELWEQELSAYNERLAQVEMWRPDLSRLVDRLPVVPLEYVPSAEGLAALNTSLFVVTGCVAPALQGALAFSILWREGLFGTISLPARFLLELWGAAHFARQTLGRMEESGDVRVALRRIQRLVLGARSEVRLPWGGLSGEKSIHVMDFVRSLADVYPGVEGTYDFLCESCHPSLLRLMTWSLVGSVYDNWTNERFRAEAHPVVDRTLQAVEGALDGIVLDATQTLEMALPYIETDRWQDMG